MQDEKTVKTVEEKITLSDLRESLGKEFDRFSRDILDPKGVSIRYYDRHLKTVSILPDKQQREAAFKMLDESAIRRARLSNSSNSYVKKMIAAIVLILVISFSFSSPLMANTSPAAEKWYVTATAYVKSALEWMNTIQQGFQTLTKGIEYMTKVMDNQLGAMFDLQTEQYNKEMSARGTATESILTQMENQQKAWARLSSRPGSNVCVDGALYGGWLGLRQEMGKTTIDDSDEAPVQIPEVTETGPVVAPLNVVADIEITKARLRNRTATNNIKQRNALLRVSALADATEAANDAIQWNHDSSRLQSDIKAGANGRAAGPDLSRLLTKRLNDVLEDPSPTGGKAAVSDNRLKVLASSSLELMKQQGWDESMSVDDYFEFLVMRYMTPGYGEFLNSGGPGVEPLLREIVGTNVSVLQLLLENLKVNKKMLEIEARNVMAESVLPDRQKAVREAIVTHEQSK